jgi:hypothetical protein
MVKSTRQSWFTCFLAISLLAEVLFIVVCFVPLVDCPNCTGPNRLIVGAGIILAEAGVPRHAPEMKALSAALRAVNRAGAVPWSHPVSPMEKETILAHTPSEAQRFRRAAP